MQLFVGASGEHAIVEVVVGLHFARPWQPREIERLRAANGDWRKFLPRMSQHQTHELPIGPQGFSGAPRILPTLGLDFDRILPDGNIGWRARADENSLFINCLEYDRWSNVWPRVHDLMSQVIADGLMAEQAIAGITLQYIDRFNWSGSPEAYDATKLVEIGSDFVPSHIASKGPIWHLHQGWFEEETEPTPGRVLNRVHFDAIFDDVPSVKLDTILRKELVAPLPLEEFLIRDRAIDQAFDRLHDKNKEILRGFLRPDVLSNIGFDEA